MLPFILILIIVFLSILLLIISLKYFYLKGGIRQVKSRLSYLKNRETNLLVDSPSRNPELLEIIQEFNVMRNEMNAMRQRILLEEAELKNSITNLSHDLRTPLTSILGYTKLLMQDASNFTEAQLGYLKIIESRITTLKGLLEDLFNYSTLLEQEQLNLEAVDISSLLEETILLFYHDFTAKGITPEIKLLGQPQIKVVDKLLLKRVFINLIHNALKHGEDEVSIIQTDTEIIFKNKVSQIDQIDVEKLFNRFFTVAKARTQGSVGLGLTIAKLLIERLNGDIKASLEAPYLSFTIRLT